MNNDTIQAVHKRMDLFCQIFGVEKPTLSPDEVNPELPAMDGTLRDWLKLNPVNEAWLLRGDMRELLARDMARSERLNTFEEKVGDLDLTEAAMFSLSLKVIYRMGANVDQVADLLEEEILDRRQKEKDSG